MNMPHFLNEEMELIKINFLILGYEAKKKNSGWHVLSVTWE